MYGAIIMSFREEMAKEMSDLLARWVEEFVITTEIHNRKSKPYPLKNKQMTLIKSLK